MNRQLSALVTAIILALSVPSFAQYGTGLDFNIESYQKMEKADLKSLGFSGTLPSKVSLKEYTPFIGNQGLYGTCVGWGVGYAALSTSTAKQMGLQNKHVNTATAYCPFFIYNQISQPGTQNCDRGTSVADALNLLLQTGAKRYNLPTYDCGMSVADQVKRNAARFRIKNAKGLFEYPATVRTLEDAFNAKLDKITPTKQSLANGIAVPIAMMLPQSFDQSKGEVFSPTSSEIANPLKATQDAMGNARGHAMAIIGYDDNKYGGAFEIMNSWGEAWGNKGYIWIRYSDYSKFVVEAYTFSLYDRDWSAVGCQFGDCFSSYSRVKVEDGSIYEGEVKDGYITGTGMYIWPEGEVHSGEWLQGQRNGRGVSSYINGTERVGYWEGDSYKGNVTKAEYAKSGCISGDCTNGYGAYKYSTGDTYVGYFKNKYRDGFGTYTWMNGDTYTGMWTSGRKSSFGMYQIPDGAFYIGEYKNDAPEGYGLEVSREGKYMGGTYANGAYKGRSQGLGFAGQDSPLESIMLASEPFEVEASASSSSCLEGNCKDGYGKFKFPTGELYTGEFKNGTPHGFGTLEFGNNVRYTGQWKYGLMEGVGRLDLTEAVFIGIWKNGQKHGYGVEFKPSGNYTTGIWEHNKFTSKKAFGMAAADDMTLPAKSFIAQAAPEVKSPAPTAAVAKAAKKVGEKK